MQSYILLRPAVVAAAQCPVSCSANLLVGGLDDPRFASRASCLCKLRQCRPIIIKKTKGRMGVGGEPHLLRIDAGILCLIRLTAALILCPNIPDISPPNSLGTSSWYREPTFRNCQFHEIVIYGILCQKWNQRRACFRSHRGSLGAHFCFL
jgi:hypothetical protein